MTWGKYIFHPINLNVEAFADNEEEARTKAEDTLARKWGEDVDTRVEGKRKFELQLVGGQVEEPSPGG